MNILLVDDHPIITDLYQQLLSRLLRLRKPFFYTALNSKEAFTLYNETSDRGETFQLAIIDHSIPSYPLQKISSGSDIALLLKKKMPNCKVVINTAHIELALIYDIHKRVSPDALIIKNDISIDNFCDIITVLLQSETTYLSPTVKKCIKKIWEMDVLAEDFNRQILYFLAKGYKIKEIEEVISLSASSIQKRIILMKKVFSVNESSSLIKIAIEMGYV